VAGVKAMRCGAEPQAARGAAYLVARYGLGVFVSLGNMLVLTWLIGPHAYGVFVTAIGIVAVLSSVARCGVDTYLVRCESGDTHLYYVASTAIAVASCVFMGAGAACTHWLRTWLGSTEFAAPYLILLLSVPVSALIGVPTAKLERELNFRAAAGIELGGQVLALLVSLSLALAAKGVWAPVAGQMAGQLWNLGAAHRAARLVPRWRMDLRAMRPMLAYGAGLTTSSRLWQLRSLVNPLVVGRLAGAEAVAFVALAIRIAENLGTIRLAAGRLALATLSRLQSNEKQFRRTLQRATLLQLVTLGPLLCAFSLAGPWAMGHILGARWAPSLAVYPFVAAGVLVNSIYNLQASALFVAGKQWVVAGCYGAHVGLLGAGTLWLLPRIGIAGYGWAEIAACAAYLVMHPAMARNAPISYRKLVPLLALFLVVIFFPAFAHGAGPRNGPIPKASRAAEKIPASFFGLHFRRDKIAWPALPLGALRLWDTETRWQNLNPSRGRYEFRVLDDYLRAARDHGIEEVFLTVGVTPAWAAADPGDVSCDYASAGAGGCQPPADLQADGTGANQYFRDFIYNLGTHVARLDKSSFAAVTTFSVWNEFTRGEESEHASWAGTNAQMLRMAQDANCILAGRGGIGAAGESCTPEKMRVPGVALWPKVKMATPEAVPQAASLLGLRKYLAQPGALEAADMIAVHAYSYDRGGRSSPEFGPAGLPQQWSQVRLATGGREIPTISSEGSWGDSARNLPDADSQMGFLARYYLVGWAAGFRQLYWYAADNSWGRLIAQNGIGGCRDRGTRLGCPTKAASAWKQAYRWMVGNTMSKPCAAMASSPVWTCELARNDGTRTLAVWDVRQSCHSPDCSTSSFAVPRGYRRYYTLDNEQPHAILGTSVAIGYKPILLSQ
jgi:PST family polysaccharide transporter